MVDQFGFFDRIKYYVWRYAITPIFPYVRNIFLDLRIVSHSGRQPWLIGWFDPKRSLDDFLAYLESIGFHNHFVAWVDDGQIVSFRKKDGFHYQYHLRIFDNGEIRGHYEQTPEAHPLGHFNEIFFESRLEDFQKWLGGWVIAEAPRPEKISAFSFGARETGKV